MAWEVVEEIQPDKKWEIVNPSFKDAIQESSGAGATLASNILEGVAGLGDIADLAVSKAYQGIYGDPTGSVSDSIQKHGVGNALRQSFDALTGVPESTKINSDSFIGAAGRQIPNLVFGPANIFKNTVLTGLQALGAGTGRTVGGEAGETIGSILGPLAPSFLENGAKSIFKMLGPQTEKAAMVPVGEMAIKQGLNKPMIQAAIKQSAKEPLGAMKSTAETLGSSSLAAIEDAMASGDGMYAEKFGKYRKEIRPAAREQMIGNVSQARGLETDLTGNFLKDALTSARDKAKKVVSSFYEAIDDSVKAPILNVKRAFTQAQNKYFADLPISSELNTLKERIFDSTNKNQLSIKKIQAYRSAAGDIARNNVGNQTGALASAVQNALANAIDKAPRSAAKSWRLANSKFADYAKIFKKGPLADLLDDKSFLGSKMMDKILSSPESAKQFKEIIDEPAVFQALHDQLASDFKAMTDPQKLNFIKNKRSQLKTLLGKSYYVFDAIEKDLLSQKKLENLSNIAGNSKTAQRSNNLVEKALTGKDPTETNNLWKKIGRTVGVGSLGLSSVHAISPWVGIPLSVAGFGVDALKGRSNELVRKGLFGALTNPKDMVQAIELAQQARNTKNLFSLSESLPQSILGFDKEVSR